MSVGLGRGIGRLPDGGLGRAASTLEAAEVTDMPAIEEILPVGRRVTLLSICPRCGRLFPADRGEVCPECGFPLTVHLDRRLAQLEPGRALARGRDRLRNPLEKY